MRWAAGGSLVLLRRMILLGAPTDRWYAMFGVCVVALAVILARRLALTLRPAAAK